MGTVVEVLERRSEEAKEGGIESEGGELRVKLKGRPCEGRDGGNKPPFLVLEAGHESVEDEEDEEKHPEVNEEGELFILFELVHRSGFGTSLWW